MGPRVLHTASEGILEDLLETQELENGEIDRGVQTQSTLVGAESRVELHAVALVDFAFALVILPYHAELDDALGNGDNLEGFLVLGVLLKDGGAFEGGGELCAELASCWEPRQRNLPL